MRPSEKHSIGARQDGRAKIPGVKSKASRRISARQFLGYRTHWYHSSVSVKLPVLSHVWFFSLPQNHYLLRIWWTSWTISVGAAGCAWRCEMAPYCVAVLWPAVQSMDLMAAWTQQAAPDPMPHVQQMAEDTVSRTARCGGVLQMRARQNSFLFISRSVSYVQPVPLVAR